MLDRHLSLRFIMYRRAIGINRSSNDEIHGTSLTSANSTKATSLTSIIRRKTMQNTKMTKSVIDAGIIHILLRLARPLST
jgi:hypothetical protein